MANQEHLNLIKRDTKAWNEWRLSGSVRPDLSGADLSDEDLGGTNLISVNLSKSILCGTDLSSSYLDDTDLSEAHLETADLSLSTLMRVNLNGAYLNGADLYMTNLSGANLKGADLSDANLSGATLNGANLSGANLSGCRIYGISVWDVDLEGATQSNLVITPDSEPIVTVDNLKIAQFIYLLLNNAEIRDVIDTIGKKAVLILGRFTPERKAVLDALREALRTHGYVPILFDFDKPSSQDLTETVSTLAHLARFIIVDLSDPSSAPYEVGTIASNHIKPIQAIFHPSDEAKRVFAMFPDLIMRYHWVLPPYEYQDQDQLLASLGEHVIEPAERKAEELARLRAQEFLK